MTKQINIKGLEAGVDFHPNVFDHNILACNQTDVYLADFKLKSILSVPRDWCYRDIDMK